MGKFCFKSAALMPKALSVLTVVMISFIAVGLTSCDDKEAPEEIKPTIQWDVLPLTIEIHVVDKDGNNLLNPNVSGNWLDQPFAMLYNGTRYEVERIESQYPNISAKPEGRVIPAVFKGLICVEKDILSDLWVLKFGAFDRMSDEEFDMEFIVPNEEKSYKIHVSNTFKLKNEEPFVNTEMWLDGNKVPMEPIKIELPLCNM